MLSYVNRHHIKTESVFHISNQYLTSLTVYWLVSSKSSHILDKPSAFNCGFVEVCAIS